MNKKFLLTTALGLTLLNWVLFFAIFFYFPDLPPPGPVQSAMIGMLKGTGFPLVQLLIRFEGDPPWFYLSVPAMLLINGLIWAIALEAMRHLIRRWSRHRAQA
ncbi:exported hypothetical protein [Verrucomicrobia bacterium]|nr:exported hypothetical protein [Verrucomicrobiota bacterium]